MTHQAPPNWYPDPFRRNELRFWDGIQWTEHVVSRGLQTVDSPIPSPAPPAAKSASKIQRDVQRSGVVPGGPAGGGTVFTEQVLVVSQKAKLVEVNAEYAVYDQHGRQIGKVREIGQNLLKKAVRADRLGSRRLQVMDLNNQVLLTLTQPVGFVTSRVVVRTADGTEVGEIAQKWISILGKMAFSLKAGGEEVGSINAEDWDSWDFNIQDVAGSEVARVTKTVAGLAKEIFTKGDNYVVTLNRPLDEPLRSLVIASALALDTMLRQGNRQVRL